MKLYDISQELFTSRVFPGDKGPEKFADRRMSEGALYNLSSLSLCAHNGTHVDAPFHFLADGDTIEQIPLEKTVGYCYVTVEDTDVDALRAEEILKTAAHAKAESACRLLIKGRGVVTLEAAKVFAEAGVELVGVESQSVGPEDGPMAVHKVLLGVKTVLLEGIRLGEVAEGVYFLNAAPLKLGGFDGAPCRAILIQV